LEGRVAYSTWTLSGLVLYSMASVVAASAQALPSVWRRWRKLLQRA
jgi:hypothetical protein